MWGLDTLKKEHKVSKPMVEVITESNVVEHSQCGLHEEKKSFPPWEVCADWSERISKC